MKRNKGSFLLPLFLFPVILTYSQDLTGIWRGYFIGSGGEQYKYEIQIDQSGAAMLNGVTYSYLDTRFYGKATFTGNFSRGSNNALVQEIKTVEVKMSAMSVSCIMKCKLQYVKSGPEEFLEGTFTSAYEADTFGGKKGDDCGGGTVYLRKVKTSDFYIEPSLRAKLENKRSTNPPLVKNNPTPTHKPPVQRNTTTTKPNNTGTAKTELVKPKNEPAVKEIIPEKNETAQEKTITRREANLPPPVLKSRSNDLVQTINVSSPEVTVRLYDNGEIDDDTISVYLDNVPVLSRRKLTTAPLTVKIKLDESDPEHELIMVAENLGRIPPNTSLMIVDAGEKRYQVRITSTEQKNAMVRFRYSKENKPVPLP